MRDLNSNPFEFDSNGLNKFKVMKSPKIFGFLMELQKKIKEFMGEVWEANSKKKRHVIICKCVHG